eukprot:gene17621-20989_t
MCAQCAEGACFKPAARQSRDKAIVDKIAAKHGGAQDFNHLADYGSCAVVGSAGRLVHEATPTQGLEIDNHTAVIRFNDAPTSSTFPQVGTKTTLRIQNRDYCGWSEGKEYCLPYSM